jgi:hypothetical protein
MTTERRRCFSKGWRWRWRRDSTHEAIETHHSELSGNLFSSGVVISCMKRTEKQINSNWNAEYEHHEEHRDNFEEQSALYDTTILNLVQK